MNSVGRFAIIATCVVLVIGLLRLAGNNLDTSDGFLPSGEWFMSQFHTFPNMFDEIGAVMETLHTEEVCRTAPDMGNDLAGVIAQLFGSLFGLFEPECGTQPLNFVQFCEIVAIIGTYPIRVVVWVVGVMFV